MDRIYSISLFEIFTILFWQWLVLCVGVHVLPCIVIIIVVVVIIIIIITIIIIIIIIITIRDVTY